MARIDLTPIPTILDYMVGSTWVTSVVINNADGTPKNLTGAKIFADILQNNVEIGTQLKVDNGIIIADDKLSFKVKVDWRRTEQVNGIETLVPKLSELPTGIFKMLVTVLTGNDDIVACAYTINVLKEAISK